LILVNKADRDLKAAAVRTCADYAGALRLLRRRPEDPEDFPKALTVSALTGEGLDAAWDEMQALADWRRRHGHFAARRAAQDEAWFAAEVREGLLARLTRDPATRARMAEMTARVRAGEMTPEGAAADILADL
ncbi:MAG: methylmalonyl Co-A mutase-associated GTPase MeaB, partial [Rhodosalinus sp.]